MANTKTDYPLICARLDAENKRLKKENDKLKGDCSKLEIRVNMANAQLALQNENAVSWEQLRNMKAGEVQGLMWAFKELLKNKNQ